MCHRCAFEITSAGARPRYAAFSKRGEAKSSLPLIISALFSFPCLAAILPMGASFQLLPKVDDLPVPFNPTPSCPASLHHTKNPTLPSPSHPGLRTSPQITCIHLMNCLPIRVRLIATISKLLLHWFLLPAALTWIRTFFNSDYGFLFAEGN